MIRVEHEVQLDRTETSSVRLRKCRAQRTIKNGTSQLGDYEG